MISKLNHFYIRDTTLSRTPNIHPAYKDFVWQHSSHNDKVSNKIIKYSVLLIRYSNDSKFP